MLWRGDARDCDGDLSYANRTVVACAEPPTRGRASMSGPLTRT